MRCFDYLRDNTMTGDLFRIIREFRSIMQEYNYGQFLDNERKDIEIFYSKVTSFLDEFDFPFPNDLSSKINEELLSPEVVNKLEPPFYRYPHDASSLGCRVEVLANELFQFEDVVSKYVARIWDESVDDFSSFENGKNFTFVATATDNPEQFPGGAYYRKNGHAYTSATLFTDQMMDSFMDKKLLLVTEVSSTNLLGMSEVDIATREETYPELKTIGKTDNGYYIAAGYSFSGNVCTKLLTPDLLEKRRLTLNAMQGSSVNEVILDKEKTKYTGMILLSDGCDSLIDEYLIAIQARDSMGLEFKCLNKELYREPEIIMPEKLEELSSSIDLSIEFCQNNYGVERTCNILKNYMHDVVEPMKYSSEVVQLYQNKVTAYSIKMGNNYVYLGK